MHTIMNYPFDIEEIKAAAASATGRSHRRHGTLCEDAYAIETLKNWKGKVFLEAVAVCDGAGSCRFGSLGAKIASRVAARWLLENYHRIQYPGVSREEIAKRLISVIQRRIRKFSGLKSSPQNLKPFSCTLVAAVLHLDGSWLAVHIGDGGIVGLGENGPFIVSCPAKGDYANVTFFVTDKDAARNTEIIRNTCSVRSFALFTDGLENSLIQASELRTAPAVAQILTWLDDSASNEVSDALQTALEEVFLQKTMDDCTLALLSGVCIKS